jgi:integrase/recombinase XerC/integrase/recombinase XerD
MRKYLKLDELKALMDATRRPRDHLIIRLMYETGMRLGEVAGLKVGDVDFALGEISIQHAKWHEEGRVVPLVSESTLAMLSQYIGMRMQQKDGPLFVSNLHCPLTRRGIAHMIRKCGIAAGVDIDKCHPHVLRHTHAVYALKAGIDLRTLQQNLGHSTIETTAIYLTMDIDDRKEIYAAHPMPLTEPASSSTSPESPKETPEPRYMYDDCDRAQLGTSFTILG